MADIKDGLLVLLVITAFSAVHAISCYQCKGANTNDECSQDEHLYDCDDESTAEKYDVCQTIIFNPGTADMMISKKCAVGPCSLGKNQNKALDLDCSNNQCIECCLTDRCNYSAASTIGGHPAAIFALVAVVMAKFL